MRPLTSAPPLTTNTLSPADKPRQLPFGARGPSQDLALYDLLVASVLSLKDLVGKGNISTVRTYK